MIKHIICLFKGHNPERTKRLIGKLDNGEEAYGIIVSKCKRCGRKPLSEFYG
jgi:hypothetical protein